MPSPAPDQDPPAPLRGSATVEAIARLWVGRFTNTRQVEATLARGGPAAPELTREHRALEVVRLEAPQLGDVVLYLQECRPQRAPARSIGAAAGLGHGCAPDPGHHGVADGKPGWLRGLQVQEISQLLAGGRRRFRTSQILQEGRLVSRSHIDEHKASDDGQAWSPPGMESDG